MKKITFLFAAVTFLPVVAGAAIITTPTAMFSVTPAGAASITVPGLLPTMNPTTGLWSFISGTPGSPFDIVPNLFTLTSITFDAFNDPYLDYGFSMTNTGASTISVSFTLTDPFIGGPYNEVLDSFSDSVTDSGANPNGVVVIGVPAGSTYVHQPFVNTVNVDGINPGCTKTGAPGFSAPGCVTGATNTPTFITPTGATGTFGVAVNFTLSPGDIYTLNGRVSLAEVPEPATIGFLGTGLLGIAGLGAFRRRKA